MDPTFGARLRLQREQQQIALTSIAEQTKIKLSLLEALERDDVSRWPRGIFRRSYMRTYAQAIGLEPDSTVREFLQVYPDTAEEISAALTEASTMGAAATGRRPPMRLRFLIGSAISALPLNLQPGHHKNGVSVERAPVLEADPPVADELQMPILADAPPAIPEVEPVIEAPLLSLEPEPFMAMDTMIGEAFDDSPMSDVPHQVDLPALAEVCTRLGRAQGVGEVVPALQDAASALDAIGLILWMHDPLGGALTPVLAHGYSDELLGHLSRVPSNTDNAIASAFRSVETRIVNGSDSATGALVVPLSAPTGCAGVLALEFRHGAEQHAHVRALATILAAQLSTLFECPALAQAVNA